MLYSIKSTIHKILHPSDRPLIEKAIKDGVKIGSNNLIESEFWIYSEPYLIEIGDNCQITHNVSFFTHGGAHVCRIKNPKFDVFGKIVIGNNVYIGSGSIILAGVTVGDNVLIAAGSVVSSSIPSGYVVSGNPAKIICTIEDYIEKNMPYNTDTYGRSIAEKETILKNLDESKFKKANCLKSSF